MYQDTLLQGLFRGKWNLFLFLLVNYIEFAINCPLSHVGSICIGNKNTKKPAGRGHFIRLYFEHDLLVCATHDICSLEIGGPDQTVSQTDDTLVDGDR